MRFLQMGKTGACRFGHEPDGVRDGIFRVPTRHQRGEEFETTAGRSEADQHPVRNGMNIGPGSSGADGDDKRITRGHGAAQIADAALFSGFEVRADVVGIAPKGQVQRRQILKIFPGIHADRQHIPGAVHKRNHLAVFLASFVVRRRIGPGGQERTGVFGIGEREPLIKLGRQCRRKRLQA